MKKYKSAELISQLEKDVQQLIQATEHLAMVDTIKLCYPPQEGKWSAAQAIEHLNMYNRYYLPAVESAMTQRSKEVNTWFVPGFFGNYFTNMMLPKNVYEVKNKMKAPKGYRPDMGMNAEKVLAEFIAGQKQLLNLLERARQMNLESIKIPISISKFIKLKLGDTFRFLIAHQQRHMIQARNAIRATGVSTDKFPVILEVAQP